MTCYQAASFEISGVPLRKQDKLMYLMEGDFIPSRIPTIQKRGAAIIDARKVSNHDARSVFENRLNLIINGTLDVPKGL